MSMSIVWDLKYVGNSKIEQYEVPKLGQLIKKGAESVMYFQFEVQSYHQ